MVTALPWDGIGFGPVCPQPTRLIASLLLANDKSGSGYDCLLELSIEALKGCPPGTRAMAFSILVSHGLSHARRSRRHYSPGERKSDYRPGLEIIRTIRSRHRSSGCAELQDYRNVRTLCHRRYSIKAFENQLNGEGLKLRGRKLDSSVVHQMLEGGCWTVEPRTKRGR